MKSAKIKSRNKISKIKTHFRLKQNPELIEEQLNRLMGQKISISVWDSNLPSSTKGFVRVQSTGILEYKASLTDRWYVVGNNGFVIFSPSKDRVEFSEDIDSGEIGIFINYPQRVMRKINLNLT